MTEEKREPAGEGEAAKDARPGELSVEDLAKVSGGRVIGGFVGPSTNQFGWKGPLGSTFKK